MKIISPGRPVVEWTYEDKCTACGALLEIAYSDISFAHNDDFDPRGGFDNLVWTCACCGATNRRASHVCPRSVRDARGKVPQAPKATPGPGNGQGGPP